MAFVMILLLIHWNLSVDINFSKEKGGKRKRKKMKKMGRKNKRLEISII